MKPIFLGIGAQKSGTTWLHMLFKSQNNFSPPIKKELHYFDSNYSKGIEWYLSHFSNSSGNSQMITGEISPSYLFHVLVPSRVREFNSKIKLIALLRDPVTRAYSSYWHQRNHGHEDRTFEQAIADEPDFIDGEMRKLMSDPNYDDRPYRRYSYLSRGRYFEQFERWFRHFPRDQFLIVGSDSFFSDTKKQFQLMCEFVGLKMNDFDINSIAIPNRNSYPPMEEATKRSLANYFEPYNFRLFELLGREFEWSRPSP